MMRLVLLYLVLVGFPIVAVFCVLRVGQRLSAPVSVAGQWNAQLSFPASIAGDPVISPGTKILNISQSGSRVFLTFDDERKTTLAGSIQEMTLDAGLLDAEALSNPSTAIHFHGQVNRQTEPNQLIGVLTLDRELQRIQIPLTARRLSNSRITMETH